METYVLEKECTNVPCVNRDCPDQMKTRYTSTTEANDKFKMKFRETNKQEIAATVLVTILLTCRHNSVNHSHNEQVAG